MRLRVIDPKKYPAPSPRRDDAAQLFEGELTPERRRSALTWLHAQTEALDDGIARRLYAEVDAEHTIFLGGLAKCDRARFERYAEARLADATLSEFMKSCIVEHLAPHPLALQWVESLLQRNDSPSVWVHGVGQAIRKLATAESTRPKMKARLEQVIEAGPPPFEDESSEWTEHMLWRECLAVSADVLEPPRALELLRPLVDGAAGYGRHLLVNELLPRLALQDDAASQVEEAVGATLGKEASQMHGRILAELASHPDTRQRVRVALETAIRRDKGLLRRTSVVIAAARSGADLTGVKLTALQTARLERGRAGSDDVVRWLLDRRWLETPPTAPMPASFGGGVDSAADPQVVRRALEHAGVAIGFDAEAGCFPVDYEALLADMARLFEFRAQVAAEPVGEAMRYRIALLTDNAGVELEFEDTSDYYDVSALCNAVDALLAEMDDPRRLVPLRTGDQSAFLVLARPEWINALTTTWGLKARPPQP